MRDRALALLYAATILVSAFLLFQVQPLVSKRILPWFGGSPAVWTTCLMFFQALLFAGYAYAHFSERWLRPRRQAMVHLGMLGRSGRSAARACRMQTGNRPARAARLDRSC